MFTKTMKFDDLDGNEVEQKFYFNYTKKEIAELLEFGRILRFPAIPGREYMPLDEMMKKLTTPVEESGLTQRQNNEQAYEIFESLLLDAYGVKGADNVSFDKTPELRHYWSTHVAFPELVFEFLGDTQLAAQFIEKCLPPRLVARAKEEMQAENEGKLSSSTISEMVEEADRRQKDPATRIEPGLKAAQEAGVAPVIQSDSDLVDGNASDVAGKLTEGKTDEELLVMSPQEMSKAQLMRAFQLKNQA